MTEKHIWTIGHSTHALDTFISILSAYEIKVLADIRTFPGSRRYPHFNKELLSASLASFSIRYIHFPELGGRRKPKVDSMNTAWRNDSFKGYADYMESVDFKIGAEKLSMLATDHRVAYMCSESLWWKCHRALLSDYFKIQGWSVHHIYNESKAQEHPYTSAAKPVQGKLFYS
jgi:uncharacterized protein (DUF488 family)